MKPAFFIEGTLHRPSLQTMTYYLCTPVHTTLPTLIGNRSINVTPVTCSLISLGQSWLGAAAFSRGAHLHRGMWRFKNNLCTIRGLYSLCQLRLIGSSAHSDLSTVLCVLCIPSTAWMASFILFFLFFLGLSAKGF